MPCPYRPRLTAHAPEGHGCSVLIRVHKGLGFFPGRDPHDLHGVADHVGGALLAFRASGHQSASTGLPNLLPFVGGDYGVAAMDVQPGQIWECRQDEPSPWRRAHVMNVILDEVELKYLDRPDLPDLAKIFRTKYSEMLSDTKHYRLLRSTRTAP
jgi:hypothetical protein